jgi:hypothetical protein
MGGPFSLECQASEGQIRDGKQGGLFPRRFCGRARDIWDFSSCVSRRIAQNTGVDFIPENGGGAGVRLKKIVTK